MKMIKYFKENNSFIKEYGIICFYAKAIMKVSSHLKDKELQLRILKLKHKIIVEYLSKKYCYIVDAINEKEINPSFNYQKCIWTAWFQGESDAPEIIHLTISSMRNNSNGHRVIVLSNDNIDSYINIPDVIRQKVDEGVISLAHYSDIVRMMVLAKYGGVWLDATMFLSKPIDEKAFTDLFFSVGRIAPESKFVSNNKWIVGIIGGCKNSKYILMISKMLLAYWTEHNVCIDYFVFDYLIAALYYYDNGFKSLVDSIHRVKGYSFNLKSICNQPYDQDIIDCVLNKNDRYPEYLTYKYKYIKVTPDGKETNYGYLCRNNLVN